MVRWQLSGDTALQRSLTQVRKGAPLLRVCLFLFFLKIVLLALCIFFLNCWQSSKVETRALFNVISLLNDVCFDTG